MFYPDVSDHSSYATVHVREHEKDRLEVWMLMKKLVQR